MKPVWRKIGDVFYGELIDSNKPIQYYVSSGLVDPDDATEEVERFWNIINNTL